MRLTGRYMPAIVAGLIFAFTPYRLSHAMGHLNLMGTQWLPLFFLCLTEVLLQSGGIGWAVAAAASFVAIAGTSGYYLYMTALISVPYAVVLLAAQPRAHRDARLYRAIVVFAIVAVPAVAALMYPYLSLARQGLIVPHTIDDVRMWSARPIDFLVPSPMHWLVGDRVAATFDRHLWIESTLTAGFVTYGLAFIGWWTTRRESPAVRGLAVCAGCAFVLALGTDLHWQGLHFMTAIARLPGVLLFHYLPFYGAMRVWTRWGFSSACSSVSWQVSAWIV